jgi:hypothetical protein
MLVFQGICQLQQKKNFSGGKNLKIIPKKQEKRQSHYRPCLSKYKQLFSSEIKATKG